MFRASLISELEAAIVARSQDTGAILRQITDLFLVQSGRFSPDQLSLYDDVFTRLVETIEDNVRAELSRRLAPVADAPRRTTRRLALDPSIAVAGPILSGAAAIDDDTLAECAASRSQEHLLAIAGRPRISERVSDRLIERGDRRVLGAVASNPGAQLSETSYATLVDRAADDDWLADCVAGRPDIPESHLRGLVAKASQTVLTRLTANNPLLAALAQDMLPALTGGDAATHDYRVAELVVKPLAQSGQLDDMAVRRFAEQRMMDEVIVSIATLSGIAPNELAPTLLGPWSSPVAIVAKAVGLTLPTLAAIYQARGVAGGRLDFEHVKAEFINLRRPTAERIIRFYKTRSQTLRAQAWS